jgi:uncharacterized protein (DUF983 family)
MDWNNLKENKCPNCGKGFDYRSFKPGKVICIYFHCGFEITIKRYTEIVVSKVQQEIDEAHERKVINE